MITRTEERRQEAIDGTKAIWSVTTYSAAIILTFLISPLFFPLMKPLETPGTPLPLGAGILFWLLCLVVLYTSFRNRVWRPIHALARILNDPRVMRQHCVTSMRSALPYALVFVLPLALTVFEFQVWVMALLFGTLIFVDNWMGTHRQPRIARLVDRALSLN